MFLVTVSPLDPQTYSEKLVRSAAVNLNVRFGPLGVLSELCLAHGITPDTCIFSDKTDFKIDRSSYESEGFADFETEGTGRAQTSDSVCVKLLRLYSRSDRRLVAIKQASEVALRVPSGYLYSPEVFP